MFKVNKLTNNYSDFNKMYTKLYTLMQDYNAVSEKDRIKFPIKKLSDIHSAEIDSVSDIPAVLPYSSIISTVGYGRKNDSVYHLELRPAWYLPKVINTAGNNDWTNIREWYMGKSAFSSIVDPEFELSVADRNLFLVHDTYLRNGLQFSHIVSEFNLTYDRLGKLSLLMPDLFKQKLQ